MSIRSTSQEQDVILSELPEASAQRVTQAYQHAFELIFQRGSASFHEQSLEQVALMRILLSDLDGNLLPPAVCEALRDLAANVEGILRFQDDD